MAVLASAFHPEAGPPAPPGSGADTPRSLSGRTDQSARDPREPQRHSRPVEVTTSAVILVAAVIVARRAVRSAARHEPVR